MRNKKVFNRSLSLLLSLVMILSMLPMTVFGASESMGNMITGTYGIPGVGDADKKWMGYGDIHGYKISVWYAPTVEEDNAGNPIYGWDNEVGTEEGPKQIGNTVYWRKSKIDYNGYDMPSFWSEQSVYDQTTRGQGYTKINSKLGSKFSYYITPDLSKTAYQRNQDNIDYGWNDGNGSMFEGMQSVYDRYKLELDNMYQNGLQDTFGYKELYDYVSRLYDNTQEWRAKTGYSYALYDLVDSTTAKDENDRMTPSGFVMPLSKAQIKGSPYTSEYIKSYFLNPLIINEIAYTSYKRNSAGEVIKGQYAWTYEDFIYGTLRSLETGEYVSRNGQFKIYIEPVNYRYFNGVAGVMSWREMVLEYHNTGFKEGPIAKAIATWQVSDALSLQKEEPTLKVNGMSLGKGNKFTSFANSDSGAQKAAKDLNNTLGIGVLTSPSLNDYIEGPEIIKTYVVIDDVDENGNITYKKYEDTRMGLSAFNKDIYGNITNNAYVPPVDNIHGEAVLNDIFTTDKKLSINENTEWVNTDLPVNIGYDLSLTAEDIAGYCFGIFTESDVFVDAVEKREVVDGISALPLIQSAANGYRLAEEQSAAAASESTAIETKFELEVDSEASGNGFTVYTAKRVTEKVKVVDSVRYVFYEDILLGKINPENGKIVKISEEDKELMGLETPANTIVLRYIVHPAVKQYNVVEVYNETKGQIEKLIPSEADLNYDEYGNYTIQQPTGVEAYNSTPELINWVTNYRTVPYDLLDETGGSLPEMSPNGQTGTSLNISNYPFEPTDHNLYVKWRINIQDPPPPGTQMIPQWRLSKFFGAYSAEIGSDLAGMSLTLKKAGCGHGYYLGNPGYWNYSVINPSGSSSKKVENWIHAETIKSNDRPYVSTCSPSATLQISANVNAIKSTDTSGLRVAKWIDSGSQAGLLSYDIQSAVKGTGSSPNNYIKNRVLPLQVKNNVTYYSRYLYTTSSWPWHSHSYTSRNATVTYSHGSIEPVISFARYNQAASRPAFTTGSSVVNNNGYTAIKYQQDKTLNIYPEYGMLFDNDSNQESIKWMVSDQARLVKPVVYQTLEHKVYVEPSSTGTIATDTRAKQKANAIGESGKPVLYKGAPVNSTFKVYRDNAKDKVGMLTVKTFALDIDTSKVSYNDWGNGSYNGATLNAHKSLVANIDNLGKATVSENLIVSNLPNGATNYIGGTKTSQSNKYEKVKYNNSNTVENKTVSVLTHKLIVRGGQVIGVELQDRNNLSYSKKTIAQLKNSGDPLYEALVNMNLYNESNDKSQTVLSTFEHKAGDTLNEGAYATLLAQTRQSVDGIATPDNAKVTEGSGWYSEDSTVLVVKEYITNYNVPSIAVSDKLSLTINGLNSPANKNDFFSKMGKGHLYLRYDLNISTGAGNANPYFEFTTLNGYKGQNDNTWGKQGCTYLVPNVSVADTTRIN